MTTFHLIIDMYVVSCTEQVLHWKSRVNRQCVERVKAFQNPTELIGQVVEMVMTLIGRRLKTKRGGSMGGEGTSTRGGGAERERESVLSGRGEDQQSSARYSVSSSSTRTPGGGYTKSEIKCVTISWTHLLFLYRVYAMILAA